MKKGIQIEVSAVKAFPRAYRALLSRAARQAVEQIPRLKPPVSLSVSVVSKNRIRALNKSFRGKDKATDVLSFPSAPVPGSDFAGDVVICWDIAKGQTRDFGTTPKEEVQRLTIHGVLHLFGYDHERSARAARAMFSLQDRILRGL